MAAYGSPKRASKLDGLDDWLAENFKKHADFGQKTFRIQGEAVKTYLFVATLGYSRRVYAQAFTSERQSTWFQG